MDKLLPSLLVPGFIHKKSLLLCFSLLLTMENLYSESFPDLLARGKEGAVFVIKEEYNLGGKTVSIPKNSTLRFEGGSLKNGTVIFQNTRIIGDPLIEVTPAGTIAGLVCINWFGLKRDDKSFDNGLIFNKVGRIFCNLYVEPGDYYCKTPIDWSNNIIINLQVDGNLYFTKANSSDTFVTLRTTRGIINFNGLIHGPTQNITDKNSKEKSVGVCFKDCNNCKIFLKSISFFYKNILVLGSSAAVGNAYNDYEFIESSAAKVLVHISSEKGGWATSNIYKILRLTSYGGYTVPDTGLLIQGEDTATSGNFSDTVIEKLCIEGLRESEPIKIIGANHFSITNIRNEANYPTLCYCQNVKNGYISTNYGVVTIRPDGASYVDIKTTQELDDYRPLDKSYVIDSDGRYRLFNCVDSDLNSLVRYSPLAYTPVGLVVTSDVLGKPLEIQCGDLFTLDVVYYDKNWKKLEVKETDLPAGNIQFKKSNVTSGYMSSSRTRDLTFVCPSSNSNVAYVGLFLRSRDGTPSPIFHVSRLISSSVVSSVMGKQQYKPYLSSGPSESRPVFSPEDAPYNIGFQYFDTTLGKVIYAKSISSKGVAVWVDADGRVR